MNQDSLKIHTRLSAAHYLVLTFSTALTLFIWQYTLKQNKEKNLSYFHKQNNQIIELIKERMQKYEDFLWASKAFVQNQESKLTAKKWNEFEHSINVAVKYPGINGIGVIYQMPASEKENFEAQQQKEVPQFKIYPKHQEEEIWPITFISPIAINLKARGLDMAHETNRFTAAKKARDTGTSQITGPITLVQDKEQTPGFLFYTPVYRISNRDDQKTKENFLCLTYAPFIFKKLVQGVLSTSTRHVTIKITDKDDILYNENISSENNYDPQAIFSQTTEIPMYGRTWTFQVQTGKSFHHLISSGQSYIILACGIFIDIILLSLFISLTRSNRNAVEYAKNMNQELIKNEKQLKTANDELTQFNYRTSHDLVAPLRTIEGYVHLAQEDMEEKNYQLACQYYEKIQKQTHHLTDLVKDLLQLCKADHIDEKRVPIDWEKTLNIINEKLTQIRKDKDVSVTWELDTDTDFLSQPTRILQIFENLISNGIKYSDPNKTERKVELYIKSNREGAKITVRDNGKGIDQAMQDKVFEMFSKFDTMEFGSGLGTYLVKKHIEALNGDITFQSELNIGTHFYIQIPTFPKG